MPYKQKWKVTYTDGNGDSRTKFVTDYSPITIRKQFRETHPNARNISVRGAL